MAWVPNSRFEDDLVDMEPDFNLVHGQVAYEEKRKQEFCPRPKSTYEYLSNRNKRNSELEKLHGSPSGKGREVRESLQMMEKIQKIAGTRPLGEHATMEDWDDTSTVEQEAVAMMRYFGMMSMQEDSMPALPTIQSPQQPIQILRNGRQSFPLINDPEFFKPRKTRRPKNRSLNDSITDSFHTAESCSSSISVYGSAKSHLSSSDKKKEKESRRVKYSEIPYEPLEESFDQAEEPLCLEEITTKEQRKNCCSRKKEVQNSTKET
ncbi:uncharacterized protein LOC108098225 [Drosophila ficusphila]|uniref:uncharacterized protein LOC108098225 n=1 Tax=Drosophila ficusphila TaxID=30025 RepID=UPI0007E888F3|nr:uncharacterized protein LOC108098225 [Drosophila ficusphila]